MAVRGLLPPAFKTDPDRAGLLLPLIRRILAGLLLFFVFWTSVFAPLTAIGQGEPDLSQLVWPQLFLLHGLLFVTLAIWYVLAFVGPFDRRDSSPLVQFGVAGSAPLKEIGIGVAAGVAAWIAVLSILVVVGLLVWRLGGEGVLPQQPPAIVPWIAGLPVFVRLGLSASAGFFEELFFRGFLQPRVGVFLSTVLFVLAHAGYEQPLMLVGVTVLSLVFANLVRWRQSIWAAVAAHAVFDALQLTIVIPKAMEFLQGGAAPAGTLLEHLG